MIEITKMELIETYLESYNSFDISGMLSLLDDGVIFENEVSGDVNLRAEGKAEFERLASESAQLFRARQQRMTEIAIDGATAEISIDYKATLATDLPNGLKSGDILELKGKTLFEFKNGKISYIKDISQ